MRCSFLEIHFELTVLGAIFLPRNIFLDLVDIIRCNVLASTCDDHILDPSADSHKTVVNRCLKHNDLISIDEDEVHGGGAGMVC